MNKDTILVTLSSEQRNLILDNSLALDHELTRRFSVALKSSDSYQIQLTPDELGMTLDALCDQVNHTKDKKLAKKLDKLIDHLEDIHGEFFDNVVMKDLAKMTGLEPDAIMAMAEKFAANLINDFDDEDDEDDEDYDYDDEEDDDYDDEFDDDNDEFYMHSENTGQAVVLKVALADDKQTWRKIAIRQGQTLHDLHDIIFDAFERYDEHLYSFYLPEAKNARFDPRKLHKKSIEFTHPYSSEQPLSKPPA